MKKSMQFLFAMSIMFEGYGSFAGTGETTAALDKPVLNAPIASPIRGQQVFIVTVMDDNYNPIAGAKVSAPCSGRGPVRTDALGIARIEERRGCNCEGAIAKVTTDKGCEIEVPIKKDDDNIAICNER